MVILYRCCYRTSKHLNLQKLNFAPSLNFIIGPNGFGKSTISNAFPLTIGGTPRTFGNTKNLKEYIRFGEQVCKLEAEIFLKEQRIKIGSGFSIANNIWYIDGSLVKKNAYDATIEKLVISVNNLYQSLPQENVVEFCRTICEDLPTNISLNLNEENPVETHAYLSDIECKLSHISAQELSLQKQKEEMELMFERINTGVVKTEERVNKIKRIDMSESKRIWVEYGGFDKDYKRRESSIRAPEKNLTESGKEVFDIEKQIENIENNPKNLDLQNRIIDLDEWDGELDVIREEIRSLDSDRDLLGIDLEYLKKEKEERAENIKI